jgi:poly(ADP-ribose) glycohydrolase ARH3
LTALDIFYRFGTPDVFVKNPSGDALYYTDDTEMMIGLAETLAELGTVDEARLVRAFADNYHPERGYGQGARRVIERMCRGKNWRALAETIFPGGSYGNGAAMRVAPVGLLFADDLDAVWRQAAASALPTHTHPVGIEGAQLLALAVALLVRTNTFDRKEFYGILRSRAVTEEFQWHLGVASKLRAGDPVSGLGSTLHAHRSVVTAMACFANSPCDFESAVGLAIGLGDDTDTVAAMTAALVGAFGGTKAIPAGLLGKLEDGPAKGMSHISSLAARLYERYTARRGASTTTERNH